MFFCTYLGKRSKLPVKLCFHQRCPEGANVYLRIIQMVLSRLEDHYVYIGVFGQSVCHNQTRGAATNNNVIGCISRARSRYGYGTVDEARI